MKNPKITLTKDGLKQEPNPEAKHEYTTNWDDSGWWTIYQKVGEDFKVWLCIEGEQDDLKAKQIVLALNRMFDKDVEETIAKFNDLKSGNDNPVIPEALIEIICDGCGNKSEDVNKDLPEGTCKIVTNYCPKCEKQHEGDYWLEFYYDKNGKLITESK